MALMHAMHLLIKERFILGACPDSVMIWAALCIRSRSCSIEVTGSLYTVSLRHPQ